MLCSLGTKGTILFFVTTIGISAIVVIVSAIIIAAILLFYPFRELAENKIKKLKPARRKLKNLLQRTTVSEYEPEKISPSSSEDSLVMRYTDLLTRSEAEERQESLEMYLKLKDSKGATLAVIAPETVNSSDELKLEPVVIVGKTLKDRLASGVEQIKRELVVEKANPQLDFYSRRLTFGVQYEAFKEDVEELRLPENAKANERKEWQEINDLFKEFQTLYDKLIAFRRVDMSNGQPHLVTGNLERVNSDELELSKESPRKLGQFFTPKETAV